MNLAHTEWRLYRGLLSPSPMVFCKTYPELLPAWPLGRGISFRFFAFGALARAASQRISDWFQHRETALPSSFFVLVNSFCAAASCSSVVRARFGGMTEEEEECDG